MPVDSPPAPPPLPPPPDKLASFREFFNRPVAVQLVRQYVVIVPREDPETGVIAMVIPGDDDGEQLVGIPDMTNPPTPTLVLLGVLRASKCNTMLILEQSIVRPRGLTDLLLRPEQIEFVTFVKSVPGARDPRVERD
jgi:hypothetical protein